MSLLRNYYDRKQDLYEIKALFDIALLHKATSMTGNSYRCLENVYSFIYGSINSKDTKENTLDYRHRPFMYIEKTYNTLLEDKSTEDFDAIDLICQDILICFKSYTEKHGQFKSINEEVMNNAVEDLASSVVELSMKLFHGETVYSLMLDTPPGLVGFINSLKGLSKLNGEQFISDAINGDVNAFRAMLRTEKRSKIGKGIKNYVDMQGLYGVVVGQYGDFAKYHSDFIDIYRVRTAIDTKTDKGFVDKSTQKTADSKGRFTDLPDYSLTGLFEKCRKLDTELFTPNNKNHHVYSIIEWYIDMKSQDFIKVYKSVIDYTENDIRFMPYISTYESNLVLGREDIRYPEEEYIDKINTTCSIFRYLYDTWYSSDIDSMDRLKINELCSMCEVAYKHVISDYYNGQEIHTHTAKRITQGVLNICRGTGKEKTHYVNLRYYNTLNSDDKELYARLTDTEKKIINIYNDNFIQERVNEKSKSPLSRCTTNVRSDLHYVLLPEGYNRICEIMSIFSELDDVYNMLTKCGLSMQGLLPAYYNAEPCSLYGAFTYMMQAKKQPSVSYTNPVFSRATMERLYENTVKNLSEDNNTIFTFDWSLPTSSTPNFDNKNVSNGYSVMQALCGIGEEHYPKYLESALYTILKFALPESIKEDEHCYLFTDTLTSEFGDSSKSVYADETFTKSLNIKREEPIPDKSEISDFDFNILGALENLGIIDNPFDDIDWENNDTDLGNINKSDTEEKPRKNNLKYIYDIRREFFASATVDRIYTVTCLISLLFSEFYLYRSKDYNKDEKKTSKYNKNLNKKNWTNETYNRSYKDYISTGDNEVRYIPGRVEDVIVRIAPAFRTALTTLVKVEYSSFTDALKGLDVGVIRSLLDTLSKQLTDYKTSLAITSLMEEDFTTIKARLASASKSLELFKISGNFCKFIFTSVDTILIDGIKYDVSLDGNKLVAVVKEKYNDYTNVQSCAIDFQGNPVSVNGISIAERSLSKNLFDIAVDEIMKASIHLDNDYEMFIKECSNNSSINYVCMYWEPLVSRLAKLINLAKIYYDTDMCSKGRFSKNICGKDYYRDGIAVFMYDANSGNLPNRSTIVPIVINTTKVWQLLEHMFTVDTNDDGTPSENVIGKQLYNLNTTVYSKSLIMSNEATDAVIKGKLYSKEVEVNGELRSRGVDISPCSLFNHVTTTLEATENSKQKTVHNYFWTFDAKGYPKGLEYLATWNTSKLIVESFASIHQIAYAYTKIYNTTISDNKLYKNMLYKGIVDIFCTDTDTTPMQELDSESVTQLTRRRNSSLSPNNFNDGSIKYKLIEWASGASNIDNAHWERKSRQLMELQYGNINFFFSPGQTNALDYKFSICSNEYYDANSTQGPITSLLNDYCRVVSSIRKFKVFDIKGYNAKKLNNETGLLMYNNCKDAILNYIHNNENTLWLYFISMYNIGYSLGNENFYKRKQYTIANDTGILFNLDGQPIMREVQSSNWLYFLHKYNCWIKVNKSDHSVECEPFGV